MEDWQLHIKAITSANQNRHRQQWPMRTNKDKAIYTWSASSPENTGLAGASSDANNMARKSLYDESLMYELCVCMLDCPKDHFEQKTTWSAWRVACVLRPITDHRGWSQNLRDAKLHSTLHSENFFFYSEVGSTFHPFCSWFRYPRRSFLSRYQLPGMWRLSFH